MAIKQIAFFGDSYCYDSKQNPMSRCSETGEETYIDLLSLPAVHFGTPGHGPNWTIHQLQEWLKENDSKETFFVFCWSDVCRDILAGPNDADVKDANIHPDELSAPGPDTPMVNNLQDQRWAQALRLWWIHLRNPNQYYRYWETTKLAFKHLLWANNILNYKEFFCFQELMEYEDNRLDFIQDGKVFGCLYDYAHYFPDYGENGVHDLNYKNHFSPTGHKEMARYINKIIGQQCE